MGLDQILEERLHWRDDEIFEHLMNGLTHNKTIKRNQTMRYEDVDWHKLSIISNSTPRSMTQRTSNLEESNNSLSKLRTLRRNLETSSRQECALEILNRISHNVKKRSCCYKILGFTVYKSSIRNVLIVLVTVNILCFVW